MKIEYDDYEEGSWDLWEKTLNGHQSRTFLEDSMSYLPSPVEIEERKAILEWLQMQGFGDPLIYSVMRLDHPGIVLVRKLTLQYGPREAERRLEPFLLDAGDDFC